MKGFLDFLKGFQQFFVDNWKVFLIGFIDFVIYLKIIGLLDILRASKIQKKYTFEDGMTWFELEEKEDVPEE